MRTYSLFELHEHLRRVIALNFRDAIWVVAEIVQAGSAKGHWYLTLAEKSGDQEGPEQDIAAQAQAMLWQRDYRRLAGLYGPVLYRLLQAGTQARLLVRPDFHERYGWRLQVEDIDPEYAIGQLALQRMQTLEQLRQAGLTGHNKRLKLPAVPRRIAVISSKEAAGLQDFLTQLRHNAHGYHYSCTLFHATVQGRYAPPELCAALDAVEAGKNEFDAVVIIRGGGARLDLMAFDDPDVCFKAAALSLPLLSGIGHETDEALLDQLAFAAFKTPTAVADFLIEKSLHAEIQLEQTATQIRQWAVRRLQDDSYALANIQWSLGQLARQHWYESKASLQYLSGQIPFAMRQYLRAQREKLQQIAREVAACHPQHTLQKGYAIVWKSGHAVRSASEIAENDVVSVQFADGIVAMTRIK